MSARLIESLSTTEALAEIFADHSVLQAMLDFEVALARAEAGLGIIPASAAKAIAKASRTEKFDCAALARATLRAGTPAIPMVKVLRQKVAEGDPSAADFVHWGATSQDVADTALILLLKKAAPVLESDLDRMERALEALVVKHENTVMMGRTLLQPAPPVTLGLKAAGWLGSVRRGRARLRGALSEALVLQFGGASGTLAALGQHGIRVGESLAKLLGLVFPDAPWHVHRDRLASLVCACGVLTASLGKMARDISLLMQAEVGEIAQPVGADRGGSSTMPQKRNPIASSLTLAAASRVPGLVAAFLIQMVQEHERGVGGWQAESPTIAAIIQSTGVAVNSMAEAAEGLIINHERMRQNLSSTGGSVFAEKAVLMLTRKLGRERSHELLRKATDPKWMRGRSVSEVLLDMPEIKAHLINRKLLSDLDDPQQYLGSAQKFAKRLTRSASGGARPRR